MPREASRPAKLPYIPPEQRQRLQRPKEFERRVRTRSIKVTPRGDIKDDAVYCKQNPSTVLSIKRHQGLWSVSLKQDGRRMRFRHP